MDQEQLNALAPQFRDAYKSIANLDSQYYKQDDLELANTADTQPWEPSESIRNLVPNIEETLVQVLDDATNFEDLLVKFVEEKNIGLVLMGPKITRREKPAIIVLTTRDIFYVIDPDFKEGIQFVDACLKNESLTMWTTDGLHEASCLLEQFNISLLDSQATDCLGLHLHMMKILKYIENSQLKDMYPERAIRCSRRDLKLDSFDDLIYTWLEIDNRDSVHCVPGQLAHLFQRPLNLTALNLIRKRCSLVLVLAEVLMRYIKIEPQIINKNILNTLTSLAMDGCDDIALKGMRKFICNSEAKKRPIKTHFAHIDSIDKQDLYEDYY